MGVLNNIFANKELASKVSDLKNELDVYKEVDAVKYAFSGTSILYDGEKNPYELGTSYNFLLDYQTIAKRSWEAYIKSPVIQTAIKQYCLWIVGSGLKFQAEPNIEYLEKSGITLDQEVWSKNIEAQFRNYASSKKSTYSREMNIHVMAAEVLKSAILSGDCLVILRYKKTQPTVQVVEGKWVQTPYDYMYGVSKYKNIISEGVEVSKTGQHIAYHVLQDDGSHERILANPSGDIGGRQAWLVYGLRHKINDVRGMSLLTAVLERDAKLDRFLEATVGGAEENSKIPFTFEHDQFSDNQNPLEKKIAQATGIKQQNGLTNETETINGYATQIAATTGKNAYNLPVGVKLKTNTSHVDPNFSSFFNPNAEFIFSTIGIPPEVAMSKYGGSFSGSRAAGKGWEFKMSVERESCLTENYYKPIYQFFFLINMYKGNINANGYRDALYGGNWMITEAYTKCRFIGQAMPHIDPVKEATAQRISLGKAYEFVPLQTGEQACENSNAGDFDEVQKKSEKEIKTASYFIPEKKNQEKK
jgi:capsid protein